MKNKLFSKVLVVMAILFFFTGCIEPMYIGHDHDRREGRHERHHRSREHRGVDIDIRH